MINEISENNEKINLENQNNMQIKDIADCIATIIVDKIISDAVINSKINDIYKTMNNHCFKFLTNCINPYLKTRFIFYENGKEDPNQQKKELFFISKPIEKLNTWSILPEPNSSQIDRCANTKTKLVRYKKYTDLKDDGLKESSFALDAEEDIKQINKNNHNFFDDNENNINYNFGNKSKKENKYSVKNSQKNILQISKKENKNKENDINSNNKVIKKKEEKKKVTQSYNYNNQNFPQKKEKEEILEISTINDLPEESYENKYSLINSNEENEKLRKEREFEIIKKEEMKKIEKERQEKNKRQSIMRRNDKLFDSNRLTFDPDGKIINIKYQNYDNLEGGFVFSKLKIKTENAKKKANLNLMDIIYPIEGVDQNASKEKRESVPITRRDTLKGKEKIINSIESDKSKIKVEKNEEDKLWENNKNIKDKKESIIPSGGNFDKIVPETGVIITGENHMEVKEGGFDYVKKYNKASFSELSKYISESINLNSRNFSSIMYSNNDLNRNKSNINNYLNNNNDYIKTDDNNYIGYKEEFNDNNPLIKNAHYINNNMKNFSPNPNRYSNLSLNSSNLNSKRRNLFKSYDKVKSENNQLQNIQLSNNIGINNQSLKKLFEDDVININTSNKYLKSLDANNLQNLNYLEKAVLPFKNLRYKKQNGIRQLIDIGSDNSNNEGQYYGQAVMNKFNSQILNNKEWGKDDEDIYKMQAKMNKEMNGENQNQSLFRKQRNNNRMKNFGMQIMTEGNNKRERRVPLFGGNIK